MVKTILEVDNDGNCWIAEQETENVSTYVKINKRHFEKGKFLMESFDFLKFQIEKQYNYTDLRLILALKLRLDYNNRIKTFRQAEIAEELGTKQSNISKSMTKLKKDGVIEKIGNDYYFAELFVKGAGDTKKGRR